MADRFGFTDFPFQSDCKYVVDDQFISRFEDLDLLDHIYGQIVNLIDKFRIFILDVKGYANMMSHILSNQIMLNFSFKYWKEVIISYYMSH